MTTPQTSALAVTWNDSGGGDWCSTPLPYPARRIGHYLIVCGICGARAVVSTAGRRDDPRSIKMACRQIARA